METSSRSKLRMGCLSLGLKCLILKFKELKRNYTAEKLPHLGIIPSFHLKWYISRSTFLLISCFSLRFLRQLRRLDSVTPARFIISSAYFSISSSIYCSLCFISSASLFLSFSFSFLALLSC